MKFIPERSPSWMFSTATSVLAILSLAGLAISDSIDEDEFGLRDLNAKIWHPKGLCPNYRFYSMHPHAPFSKGTFKVPFQRPSTQCRTFQSAGVESVIEDINSHFADPDIAMLFENAYPNTVDTTIRWHLPDNQTTTDNLQKLKLQSERETSTHSELDESPPSQAELDRANSYWAAPQTFVVTGDINAEWLRDSTNQLAGYQALAKYDQPLAGLIRGAINTQAEFVIRSPYCNAFQPPPPSALGPSNNGQQDIVNPFYEPSFVFECKWEIDSLAAFLSLGNQFHENTGAVDFLTPRWFLAAETLMQVLAEQSQSTFDEKTGTWKQNAYRFRRRTDAGTETLALSGAGHPLNSGTGLIRSAFRPSDDSTIFGFFIPGNAMMAVELNRTAILLEKVTSLASTDGGEPKSTVEDDSRKAKAVVRRAGRSVEKIRSLAVEMKAQADKITGGIWNHGIQHHPVHGPVFAFEVDGYGSTLLMDDANVPSLLSLPMLGFVPTEYDYPVDKRGNPIFFSASSKDNQNQPPSHSRPIEKYYNTRDAARVYANTRRLILDRKTNPYFLTGPAFSGIGGPHVGPRAAWPMSLLVEILTAPPVPKHDDRVGLGDVRKRHAAPPPGSGSDKADSERSSEMNGGNDMNINNAHNNAEGSQDRHLQDRQDSIDSPAPPSPNDQTSSASRHQYKDLQNQLHICHPVTFSHLHTILSLHAKLGLIHETVQVDNAGAYTRPWFAWANAVFGQVILRVAKECGAEEMDMLKEMGIGGYGKGGDKDGNGHESHTTWFGMSRGASVDGTELAGMMLKAGQKGYRIDDRLREKVQAEKDGKV